MEQAGQIRSFDEFVDALASAQRRRLLVALLDHNPQDDTPSVAVAKGETVEVELLIEMEHVHLPKLAQYDFIEWDEAAGEVSKGETFDEIRPLLELLADHEDELPEDWL